MQRTPARRLPGRDHSFAPAMPTTIVFGAFDRHNLGDLLFAHVAAALLPGDETLVFAGLAARDLRPFGGHRVEPLHALRDDPRLRGARLLHAGGEILACTARQAATMLLAPPEVDATLAFLEAHPEHEPAWRRALLGTGDEMPYVAARTALPALGRVVFAGVGGVALDALPAAARAAVVARLGAADAATVRDARTQSSLRAAGLAVPLAPDPVVLVERLFGDAIRARATGAPVGALREDFAGGYLAVQLSAEFADDASVACAAAQLEAVSSDTGLGIVPFRAGAAPWHDDASLPARLAARLPRGRVRVFESLHAWDLCALLATARACACSSLHATIVAHAFGVPAVGLEPPAPAQGRKLAAYASTWRAFGAPAVRPLDALAAGTREALDGASPASRARAGALASQALAAWRSLVGSGQCGAPPASPPAAPGP